MLIVLLIVSIILGFLFIATVSDDELIPVALILPGICIIAMAICAVSVVNGRVIDDKIQMYTKENEVIETQIETVVAEYMEYESETLKDLKGDSAIALVSLYPELKTDEIVKTQIETYQANNTKIKELKEEKINLSNYKWWLYFGK